MQIGEVADLGVTPQQWDSIVASDPHGHFLQTWAWGEVKKAFGWHVRRWVIKSGGELVGGAQVLFRRQGPFLLAYLPKGPFFTHEDSSTSHALWQVIHRRCRRLGCFCLKFEPEWEDETQDKLDLLASNGFRSSPISIQPRSTVFVDLQASEEDILARMKPKWRYNTRLSERKGITVRQAAETDLESFYTLMQTTGQRDQFGIHSLEYYRLVYELFSTEKRAHLLLAYYQEEPLAALMLLIFNQQSWFLYGASSNAHREMMPNQLLQWRAMQLAKAQGCRQYDLWGIQDTGNSQEDTDLSGVGRFKLGFGGHVVRYVGAYDYVYVKPLYWIGMRYWLWKRQEKGKSAGIGAI